MRPLLVAMRFLTRVPLPDVTIRDGDLATATGLFPVVGVLVATVATLGWSLGWFVGGATVAAVLAVATATVVTGAFHDDGLADVADGWFGGWEHTDRLAIMRDSRVGTFGASALVLAALAEVTLLAAPWTTGATGVGRSGPAAIGSAWLLLAGGHAAGRAGILVARRAAPVAEAGSLSSLVALAPGAGDDPATTGPGRVTEAVGVVVAVAVVAAAARWWSPVVLGATAAAAVGMARWSVAKVGGLTGDALGATARVCHLVALAGIVAVLRHG